MHNFLHFNDGEEENQEIDDQNDNEEDLNNENEDGEGSFADKVYNVEMKEMEEIESFNNNNNIGIDEAPIQIENIPQPNANNNNNENVELPNQVENIQQQNENIHTENAEISINSLISYRFHLNFIQFQHNSRLLPQSFKF